MGLSLAPECLPALRGSSVMLGLSGGRDSVALLHLLLEQGVAVQACHVHHGIRGAAADADEEFCAQLCARLGLRLQRLRVDVPAEVRASRESPETAARRLRRAALVSAARRAGCTAIALAHHADDQAETALFRLARGAAGWRGMLAVSRAENLTWLRPLLHCRRREITDWVRERGLEWREDATNGELDAARNRLRHEVLPALCEALGRDVIPVICRSARLQSECAEALEEALEALPLLDPQGRLYLPFLEGRSPSFRRAVLHRFLKRGAVPQLSEKMVRAVEALLDPQAKAHCLDLPGGLQVRRRHRRLELLPQRGQAGAGPAAGGAA